MSIKQLQTIGQGGPFAFVKAPLPKPGAGEVTVRPRAVSLNPMDWKNMRFGATIPAWPAVLGIEGAGTVETVGDGVAAFKPGDEVMAWVQRSQFNGAFQEVFTAEAVSVGKKPGFLSFEEATSLPIAYLTALAAVIVGLRVAIPGLSTNHTTESVGTLSRIAYLTALAAVIVSILVLGGSSGVGASAIQLLRIALPSATIVATSSAAHHAHLRSLGASSCLPRAAQDDAAALKAASPADAGFDAILDAVGAGTGSPAIFDALRADGPKLYSLVITGPGAQPPSGVKSTLVGGQVAVEQATGAMAFLGKLLDEGRFKLPYQKIDVLGKGLEVVEKSLDLLPKVSGKKLVVSL